MSTLDSFPMVEEMLEQYGYGGARESCYDFDYDMLPVEYEEVYGA